MYMYTCKRMSCISAKAGSGCKTALAAAAPPVSAWSTPWYPITIWARMFASHASIPASSDTRPRGQWRPKGPWKGNDFLAGKKSWLQTEGGWSIPPQGCHYGKGRRKWKLPERNDSCNHSRKYSRELWEVTSLLNVKHYWNATSHTVLKARASIDELWQNLY